jgi:hypothetical protein
VEFFKEKRKEKDVRMGENIFDSKGSWVGDLAEDGFEVLLKQENIKYAHWTNPFEKDRRDFTVGEYEIDVKCLRTNYYPRVDYNVSVAKRQTNNSVVNTYVFSFFYEPMKKLLLVGSMSKEDFLKNAREYTKGYKLTEKYTYPCDAFSIYCNQTDNLEDFLFDLTKAEN